MYAIPGVVCHPWGRMLHLHHLILPLLCLALTVTLTILYDSRHRLLLLLLLRFLFLLRDLIVNNLLLFSTGVLGQPHVPVADCGLDGT